MGAAECATMFKSLNLLANGKDSNEIGKGGMKNGWFVNIE